MIAFSQNDFASTKLKNIQRNIFGGMCLCVLTLFSSFSNFLFRFVSFHFSPAVFHVNKHPAFWCRIYSGIVCFVTETFAWEKSKHEGVSNKNNAPKTIFESFSLSFRFFHFSLHSIQAQQQQRQNRTKTILLKTNYATVLLLQLPH